MPAGQVHSPSMQAAPGTHTNPHAPQLLASMLVLTQEVPHSVWSQPADPPDPSEIVLESPPAAWTF